MCAVLCALVAAFIGAFAIRRLGIYFVMITFAFAETANFLAYVFKEYTGGENGVGGLPLASLGGFGQSFFIARPGPTFYYLAAALFVVLFVILQRFVDSPVGSVLTAIRENEARAEALGYSVKAYKLVAFMVSGAVTGIAGCLYAFFVGSASVSGIHSEMAITIVIITVLGGIRSLYGSLLGAVVYVVLNTYLSDLWPYWELLLGLGGWCFSRVADPVGVNSLGEWPWRVLLSVLGVGGDVGFGAETGGPVGHDGGVLRGPGRGGLDLRGAEPGVLHLVPR